VVYQGAGFGEDDLPVKKRVVGRNICTPRGGKGALYGADRLPLGPAFSWPSPNWTRFWPSRKGGICWIRRRWAGKRLSLHWHPYLLPYRKIFVAYDMDKAGINGANL
jgi:hypothetical protein